MHRSIPAALVLAIAVVSSSLGGDAGGAAGPGVARPVPALEQVPVRVCPAATSGSWGRGPKIPRVRAIAVPLAIARQVAVFTDEYSVQSVLGPRGWKCVASYAADGGGGITVFAPDERSPGFFPHFTSNKSGLRAINVTAQPSCIGCYLQMACPYFKRALERISRGFHGPDAARCHVPRHERVRPISKTLVSVIDPPRVTGNNYPSGGARYAIGNVFLSDSRDSRGPSGSYFMTCSLPPRDHAICYASLNWFSKHWER